MRNVRISPALLGVICATACGWRATDPSAKQIEELRAELAEVRKELVSLRKDADLQAEAITAILPETPDAPPEPAAPKADLAELRGALAQRTADLADDVDADLGDLQDELDRQAEALDLVHQEILALSAVANAHADQLDQLATDVGDLGEQTTHLRTLEGVLSFEDGRVVIDGADLLLKPGLNPDGTPRPAGQILNRAP